MLSSLCATKHLALDLLSTRANIPVYLEPSIRRKRKRRSSPTRIAILLILIAAGLYIYVNIQQEQIEQPFVPTPTPTRSAISYITEAERLYLRGEMTRTIAAYRQAMALEPNNIAPYAPLSRLLILKGELSEGVQIAQRATELAPNDAKAWAALGMAYDWNGNVLEAIEACQRAIELDPTYAEGHAYLAEAYADAQRWAEAVDAAQIALDLDDQSVDVQRNYGYVLERQGNYWGALEAYERALEIHPRLAYLHIAVGRSYRRLGDISAALESFKQAVEIDETSAMAQFELGWTYLINQGDYPQAEIHLERATELNPQFSRAFGALGITYWSRRNYEYAIPAFQRAIELTMIDLRRTAHSFYVTLEANGAAKTAPSNRIVMQGKFDLILTDEHEQLQARIRPEGPEISKESWRNARGMATLNTQDGTYILELSSIPRPPAGESYYGWIEGMNTLAGTPVSTGRLQVNADGSLREEFETGLVRGAPIEYFYTLGLAQFYLGDYDEACPMFEAALQIDPEDANALEGRRMCQSVR